MMQPAESLPTQDGAAIRHRIKRLIVDNLHLDGIAPESIDEQAPLFGDGLGLDSVDALELVVALEKEFGIKIKSSEMDRQVLASVSTLSRFIEERSS
jgi:acyl carrier protein